MSENSTSDLLFYILSQVAKFYIINNSRQEKILESFLMFTYLKKQDDESNADETKKTV